MPSSLSTNSDHILQTFKTTTGRPSWKMQKPDLEYTGVDDPVVDLVDINDGEEQIRILMPKQYDKYIQKCENTCRMLMHVMYGINTVGLNTRRT